MATTIPCTVTVLAREGFHGYWCAGRHFPHGQTEVELTQAELKAAFDSLPADVVGKIVDKFVAELEVQLADRKVFIELSDGARRWLAEKGYDRLFGARPLARVIQEQIKRPLAEELLFGKLVNGGEVKVRVKDNVLAFEIVSAPPKAKKKGSVNLDDLEKRHGL